MGVPVAPEVAGKNNGPRRGSKARPELGRREGTGRTGLIVSGDDFGASAQVNAGIIEAHRRGVLTSAGFMVTAPAAAEAAAAAKALPSLDVGLHVVLCNGRSLLPPARLNGMVDGAGRFPRHEVSAGLRYLLDRRVRGALGDECRAQLERGLQMLGRLSHLDGHHNIHLFPVVADVLIDLAAEYGVPCIRLLRESTLTTLALARDRMALKLVEGVFFRWLTRRARRLMAERGLFGADWLFGFHQSGRLSERYVGGVIARLPARAVTEFYFHPAGPAGAAPPDPKRLSELKILTSPAFSEALVRRGVTLTTFAALAAERSAAHPRAAGVSGASEAGSHPEA